jgi:penicillin-insensitive murein endopeptidase
VPRARSATPTSGEAVASTASASPLEDDAATIDADDDAAADGDLLPDGPVDALPAPVADPAAARLGDDDGDLEDDFAALAYALHGMEDPREAAEEDDDDHEHGAEHEIESDDIETPAHWSPPGGPVKAPIADLGADEIRRRLKEDPASLGSMSIGAPNRGALFNGVQMPLGDRWMLADAPNAYGTKEAIDQLIRCIDAVHERYPKSPKMIIGDWSARRGGHLRPHKSHQSGRDVDVSYYYTTKTGWYARADAKNLDRPRTWAFVKALLTKADVEMILMDTSIQRLLRDYALASGEDRAFVDRVFQIAGEKSGFAPIRHATGHATHIHVRFRSAEAVASGKIAEAFLPRPAAPRDRGAAKKALAHAGRDAKGTRAKSPSSSSRKGEITYVNHRARSGDTLDALARRYGTTVEAIRAANGLKNNDIKMKRTYRIPVTRPAKKPAGKPAKTGGRRGKRKG